MEIGTISPNFAMRRQTVFSSVLCSRRITSLISRNHDLSVFAGMQSEGATKLVCDDHDRPARNDRYVVVGPHLHIVIRSHQSHSPSPVGPVPTHESRLGGVSPQLERCPAPPPFMQPLSAAQIANQTPNSPRGPLASQSFLNSRQCSVIFRESLGALTPSVIRIGRRHF